MTWQPSPNVLAKARDYLATARVSVDGEPGVWWVKGTADKPYRVQTDARPSRLQMNYILCTCPHGANVGGKAQCAHATAVVIALAERYVQFDLDT